MADSSVVQATIQFAFDRIEPSYLLDPQFHFVRWNPLHEELFAKPYGIELGDHISEFVKHFVDGQAVLKRAARYFGLMNNPSLDIEDLAIDHKEFGLLTFRKIAALARDGQGKPALWVVNLAGIRAESPEKDKLLWEFFGKCLTKSLTKP